ncbi:probable ATP-dependent RNA helicase CG8611 [Drosophila tropicalis]|uniref:probable ATP-dependent RNA helicase CG8611 n=1 Tax=Drosophila tropicalis TaxID=46794 RepID=UPI0035ABF172
MMDNLMLNVNVRPGKVKKPPTKTPIQKRVAMPTGAANENFDFQFNATEKPKAKALVVRRRRLPTAASTPSASLKPSATLKPSTGEDLMFNVSTKPKVPEIKKISRPAETPGEDLIINVTTSQPQVSSLVGQKPKTKLSRAERLGQKKRGQQPLVKLTDEQLKRVQRRPQNPNKLPRPGDLFKAEMDEQRRQKKLNEEDLEKDAENKIAEEQEKTESNKEETQKPKPTNRFRTPKIGLFDQSDVEALQQLGQRAVKPVKETIFSTSKVKSLPLHPHAIKNLEDLLSIRDLTTVQEKAIPHILAGKDVLVRSQTGSGKTLAYALPLVEKLQAQVPKIKRTDGVMALVIVPTRELVMQTYELLQKLVKPYTWIVPGSLLGGESRKSEKARLRKGINILVGTPGRLVDHLLHTASFKLTSLQFLVLDEADRLLELGYERDVQQLVEAIDKQRAENEIVTKMQRLLLSATLTTQVQQLAGLTLKEPLYIDNSDEATSLALNGKSGYQKESIEAQLADDGLGEYQEDVTGVLSIPENLHLSYIVVPPKLRLVAISALLAKELAASPKQFKAIIFMSTTEMVNFHHDMLNEALTQRVLDEDDEKSDDDDDDDNDDGTPLLQGLRFFKLHGSMTQTERQGVFNGFRECPSCVLLATDVVGRGIDVPDIKLVIQYTPPQTTADFVHRVGRTARAGRKGRAVLFLAPSEAQFVRHLEKKRIRIQQGDMYAYLQALLPRDDEARTVQEAASNLQHKFQSLLEDDRELHDKSCKAFVSWMKFYSTFPKELKPIFNVRIAHMGHFAKSFALKEAPSKFASKHAAPKPAPPTNRLTYTERDPERMQQQKRNKRRLFTTTVTGEVRQMQQQNNENRDGATTRPGPREGAGAGAGVGRSSFMKSLSKSRALNISEFDSGLPSAGQPKRRKQ